MNTHKDKLLYAMSEHLMSIQERLDELELRIDYNSKQTSLKRK